MRLEDARQFDALHQQRPVATRAAALLLFVGSMWVIRAIDSLLPAGNMIASGVVPRTTDGLAGILTAPFIHVGWWHLIGNTPPLLILGSLLLLRGVGEFVYVVLVVGFISGVGTWLFGGYANHIGASGIVLGFVSFLLFRSAFDRKLSSFIITVIVAVGYSGMVLLSLVPRGAFSWSLHFWGFVGGFVAARLRYPSRSRLQATTTAV